MTPAQLAADRVLEQLVAEIADGTFLPGTTLPSEAELAARMGVSRLTLREAIKSLRAQRVVDVRHGRGSVVNPAAKWAPLDATLLTAQSRYAMGELGMARKLLEARRLVEVGVAGLAAVRRSPEDLAAIAAAHERMRDVIGDVEATTAADLAFHRTLMDATGNAFIAALFDPLEQLLYESRRTTKTVPEMREHALRAHQEILDAVRAGDGAWASRAMGEHLDHTATELELLLGSVSARGQPD